MYAFIKQSKVKKNYRNSLGNPFHGVEVDQICLIAEHHEAILGGPIIASDRMAQDTSERTETGSNQPTGILKPVRRVLRLNICFSSDSRSITRNPAMPFACCTLLKKKMFII